MDLSVSLQCCTIEQGLTLKRLGVPQMGCHLWFEEGADDCYSFGSYNSPLEAHGKDCIAFTAAELGELLPPYWVTGKSRGHKGPMAWYCEFGNQLPREYGTTEAEARANMLIFLLNTGILLKEELPTGPYCDVVESPFTYFTPSHWTDRFNEASRRLQPHLWNP